MSGLGKGVITSSTAKLITIIRSEGLLRKDRPICELRCWDNESHSPWRSIRNR